MTFLRVVPGMLADISITGASDDLIEVEGVITEEFSASSGVAFVYVSSGEVFEFRFGPEDFWRARCVTPGSGAQVENPDDENGYVCTKIAQTGGWVMVCQDAPLFARRTGL